jgi:hypothetical protein
MHLVGLTLVPTGTTFIRDLTRETTVHNVLARYGLCMCRLILTLNGACDTLPSGKVSQATEAISS